jgi:heptosyltransferase-2
MLSSSDRPLDFLLIRLSSFGDIVLAEPVARALKERYAGSRVAFACAREYAGLPELFSSVDAVLTYSKEASQTALAGARSDGVFDIVVDLQGNRHSRCIAGALRAGRTLRYRRPRLGRFFTVYAPWIWKGPQPPTIETYFRTLRPLGISYSGEVPRIAPDTALLEQTRAQAGDGPFVGICPGSSSKHKSWGTSRFAELIRILGNKHTLMVVGSEHDRSAVDAVLAEASEYDVGVCVDQDIGRISAILSLCEVTVSNDSGLMHLAGAVGSRPVAIFGPTSPLLGFAPAAEGSVVLTMGLRCSPCSYHGNKQCRLDRRYCMEGITPEHVASVVDRMMEEA